MALQMDPLSPPSTPLSGSGPSELSPLQRRAEVRPRHKPNASCPDSSAISKLSRNQSLESETRYSTPVLTQEQIANSYQPIYFPRLNPRRPTVPVTSPPETPARTEVLAESDPNKAPSSRKDFVSQKTNSSLPQLLTEVAEEDIVRRSQSNSRKSRRFPSQTEGNKSRYTTSLKKVTEESPPTPPPSKALPKQRTPKGGLSLFDLRPLNWDKTNPIRLVDTSSQFTSQEAERILARLLELPNPETDEPKVLPSQSLYKPSLFSTQHGISAGVQVKRKPIGSPPRVKFSVTPASSHGSLQNTTRESCQDTDLPSAPSDKTIVKQPEHQESKALGPISAKYIAALEANASANAESRYLRQVQRQISFARLRQLNPSPNGSGSGGLYKASPNGIPPPPLTLWISDLVNATKMPTPSPLPHSSNSSNSVRGTSAGNPGTDRPKDLPLLRDQKLNSRPDPDSDNDDAYAADEESATRGHSSTKKPKPTPAEELTVMIDDMLNDLTGKFHAVTSEIMAKMDDMGRRIDNLEASLSQNAEGDDRS